MSSSVIYRNRTTYELLMRGLYGRHYGARYRAIAELVPDGASVVDVCCGPATLYSHYLRDKGVDYTGLDLNEGFIARLNETGGTGRVWNMHSDDALPAADYVVMQASLYHFLPDPAPVVDRMLGAARKQVIVAEPVRNMATSDNRVLAAAARRFTDAGDGAQEHRFVESSLDGFFLAYESRVAERTLIAGGREKLYVLTA
ncbi:MULTISPECIES: class I SAM-dependent methyltransferase [Nocardia]|uniref:class I SAM-dependent methyltransferase n=1 Tax=Nocardia TaxID=1817 RepID=UPI000D69CA14|nr:MULTISPECIES: methionine biosynthesis protein MetW [Nocardia]